ncbi:MAG: hypothetical protein AAGG01_05285 [Planctomycetota bacterium]
MGSNAVTLNREVEEAHNEIFLLNIVRDMNRMPQHWSVISTVRNTETGQVNTGLGSIPFGGASSPSYDGALTGTRTTSPQTEMNVLSSAEFTRSIMAPIKLEQIQQFLRQGWASEFVFKMCVRELVFPSGERMANRPSGDTFEEFHRTLDELVKDGLSVVTNTADPQVIRLDSRPGPEQLAHLKAAGYTYQADVKLKKPNKSQTPEKAQAQKKPQAPEVIIPHAAVASGSESLALGFHSSNDEAEGGGSGKWNGVKVWEEGKTELKDDQIGLVLRSPEGMVYFLGQVGRKRNAVEDPTQREDLLTYRETSEKSKTSRKLAMFRINKGSPPGGAAAVKVTYDGETYWIPKARPDSKEDLTATGDRTLMTFTFAQIVFGLNRSRKDLPTTSLVTFGS